MGLRGQRHSLLGGCHGAPADFSSASCSLCALQAIPGRKRRLSTSRPWRDMFFVRVCICLRHGLDSFKGREMGVLRQKERNWSLHVCLCQLLSGCRDGNSTSTGANIRESGNIRGVVRRAYPYGARTGGPHHHQHDSPSKNWEVASEKMIATLLGG